MSEVNWKNLDLNGLSTLSFRQLLFIPLGFSLMCFQLRGALHISAETFYRELSRNKRALASHLFVAAQYINLHAMDSPLCGRWILIRVEIFWQKQIISTFRLFWVQKSNFIITENKVKFNFCSFTLQIFVKKIRFLQRSDVNKICSVHSGKERKL